MAIVTWKGGSGIWDTATLWSTGVIPGAGDAVTIDAAGSYTVTQNGTADAAGSLTLNDPTATLLLQGTLALGTTLAATAGTLELTGHLDGGTLAVQGATLVAAGGTLQGVTVLGPLALSGPGQSITIDGGINLLGPGGTQPGTLGLIGINENVGFADAETLDHVVITLGTNGGVFNVGSTLSLGPTTTLTTAGSFTEFGNPAANPATLENAGSIALTGPHETLEIELANFTNTGSITIGVGGDLEINHFLGTPGSFSNTGSITFASGGNLVIGDALTPDDLTGITLNGGSFLLEGAYDNTGQTLTTTATGLLSNVILAFGTIIGGTITPGAGQLLSQGGTFDGVTWNANRLAPGGQLVLLDGLTFAPGADTLDLITGGSVFARDAETLDNIFIPLGNNAALGSSGTGDLSLGVNALTTLNSAGTATIGGGTVTNAGTILVSAGELAITATAFSNPGTMAISGGTVDFAGSVTAASFGNVQNTGGTLELGGTLVNTGTTFVLPASGTFSNILLSGTIEGGTVQLAGGRIAFIRPAVLAGVTYDGTLDLSAAQAYVDISGGITLTGTNGTGPGAVLLTGAGAELEFATTTTLDNATITASNSPIGNQLSIDFSSTLTLGPNLLLIDQGPAANLLITSGKLVNDGTIEAQAIGGTIEIATLAFSNTGTIGLAAGGVLQFDEGLTVANLGSIVNTGGTVDFNGGIFTNSGNTISITAGGPFSAMLFGGGTVVGGTIVVNGGTALFTGGELSGVTFDGEVDLSAAGSILLLAGGIALHPTSGTGAGSIDLTGAGGSLIVTDTETLDAATITIGNAATTDGLSIDFGSTLTLGGSLLVQETGTDAQGSLGGFGTIVNAGIIRAAGTGGGLTIDPNGGFSNLGTLEIAAGGLLALNFNNGNAASVGTVSNSGGTFEIIGTLDNTGSLLDITALSPFAGGLLGGTLKGGTVAMDGGTLEYPGNSLSSTSGTLSAITVKGALDLSTAFATLFLTNGVSLVANGATAASVNETGAGAQLIASDNETLDNATFTIGNATSADVVDANTTLTFGAGLLLTETAAGAHASINGATIVNQGTIEADAAGGGLTLGASNFLGSTGTLSIGAGALLSVGLDGALSNLGAILNAGGTLGLSGTIVNTGSTLVIGSTGAFSDVLLNGTIDGGTVELAGGVLQFGAHAAFANLTFIGATIDLASSGALLWVHTGTTLSSGTAAPLIIKADGPPTKDLAFDGGVTLSNADILVSGMAQQLDVSFIAPGTVTFAANTSVDIASNTRAILGVDSGSAAFADAGTIHVANAGTLAFSGPSVLDTGTIALDPGGMLQVIDTVLPAAGWIGSVGGTGGTLQVASAALELGNGTLSISPTLPFSRVQNFGTIANGTIVNAGSYQANTSVLQNISFDGVLDLSAPGQRQIEENGLSLRGLDGTSPGTVVLTGLGSQLQFEDSTTLDHATVTLAGGPTIVAGTTTNTAITFASNLSFGSFLTINATTGGATSEIFGPGTLTSAATINVGAGAALSIDPFGGFGGTNFVNTGAIRLAAGGTLTVNATTTTGNLTSISNAGGTLLLGGTLNNTGQTISISPSSVFADLVLGAPSLVLNGGSIANAGGTLAFAGDVALNGVQFSGPLHVGNGAVVTFSNTSTLAPGAVSIDGGAKLSLPSLIAGQNVGLGNGVFSDLGGGDAAGSFTFQGNATLELDSPAAFHTPIAGFGPDRTIDLPDNAVTGLAYSNGTLSVHDGTITVGSLLVGTGYTQDDFSFTGDGGSGFDITSNAFACFAAGTRILTARGEVPVEALHENDFIPTARTGRLVRVRWIGHRHVNLRHHPRPWDVHPVRIHRHAFGLNQPLTDLLLSPDHAVFVDGALMPIRYLINGATIAQERVETITYYHVELDRHEVLLAEGMPAESYLDTGNRSAFANAEELEFAMTGRT